MDLRFSSFSEEENLSYNQTYIVYNKSQQLLLACYFSIVPFSPGKGDSNASSDLSEIYQRLESIEADKAPAKAAVILAGLGFTPQMQKLPTK